MSRIYSRFRIKFPKVKGLNKIRITILILFILVITATILFISAAYPIFVMSCENEANAVGVEIVTTEIKKVMSDYTYNDLISIEKDNNGNVKLLKSNIVPINEMISKVTANIQKEINETTQINVYINMGTVTGILFLKGIGPRFNIDLETLGDVSTKIDSRFESVGINQTLHKIYLEINLNVIIVTPFKKTREKYKRRNTAYRSSYSWRSSYNVF